MGRVMGKPLLCSALMAVAALGSYAALTALLGQSWLALLASMGIAIGIAVIVYAVAVIRLRALTMEDLKLIPKGEKIGRLLHMS